MIALAQVRLRIDRIDSHIPHDPADSLPVDAEIIVPSDDPSDSAIAPCWMSSVDLIDSSHQKQLLIGNGSLFRRIAVYAASIDIKKLSLSTDIDVRITEVNAVFSSSQVRGFGQIFF